MHSFSPSDLFVARRPAFFANTLVLAIIMVLYPLAGVLLLWVVKGVTGEAGSLLHPSSSMLQIMRLSQAVGQILVLALPVILLAGVHTKSRNPFSLRSLSFLGVGRLADLTTVFLAVSGIFLLQPFLQTVIELQNIYVWPALGAAGQAVIRQQNVMESFIKALALVHTIPDFFVVCIVFSFTPALCEELLFRGYIQQNYTRSMSPAFAVFLTGLIFAFFHMSAANLFPLAVLGWYIGYIYSKTGSLLVPFIVHLVNNFTALLILYFSESGCQLKGLQMPQALHSLWWWFIVAGSLLLFILLIRRFSNGSAFNVGDSV
jgi:membrane protease YdiL (CAAX protease family)